MNLIIQKICQWILVPIATVFIQKMAAAIEKFIALKKRTSTDEQTNEQVLAKTEAAQTPEERKAAAENDIKSF